MLTDEQERRARQKAKTDHLYAILLDDRDEWIAQCARKDVAELFELGRPVQHQQQREIAAQPVGFVHFTRR